MQKRPNRSLFVSSLMLAFLFVPGTAMAAEESFAEVVSRGPLAAGLAAFGSGLLVSLTPCVYPMVAVTVSVFGAQEVKSRWQGAGLAAAFVAGIVAMFVPLGVAAGLGGSVFGSVLSRPWVVGGISALFLVMAASMFGAFDLDLPSGLKNKLAGVGGGGHAGAFVLGLVCGNIAAPCTGPFLTGILAWIASTQSALMGAGAMGAFALGLGLPFFLVGAFAVQLPKSGRWMMHIKSVMGIILLIVAVYFLAGPFSILSQYAKPTTPFLAGSLMVALVGLALGAVHKTFDDPSRWVRASKGLGVLLVSVGAVQFVFGALTPERSLEWEKAITVAEAKVKAVESSRPLLVDFTAQWCASCKELDKFTFADERVKQEAGRFLAVKVDATDDEDPVVVTAMSQLKVRGLPTVVLFDSTGIEIARFTDFVEADEMFAKLRSVE